MPGAELAGPSISLEAGLLTCPQFSPCISEAKTIPPILIANGDADNSVPVAGAIRLNEEPTQLTCP